MAFEPYVAHAYLDFDALEAWCRQAAAAAPELIALTEVGTTRQGRPLLLLTVGERSGDPSTKPALWLDGGTHAAEWCGVMACLYSLSRWIEGWLAGDTTVRQGFAETTAYVMPCISPDGYQALHNGEPFIRSTLRPPRPGVLRSGFAPRDLNGDGAVRWMRWKHPAGPFVVDPEQLLPRPRTLADDPADAVFYAMEGEFEQWDGYRWTAAPREFGLDLNRNFPAHWEPFSMFGMDGGTYPLSESESRAVVDSFAARPNIAAGLTNHTYTGVLLCQPYREKTPLKKADLGVMERLAEHAVDGTGYRVVKVYPDFQYDKEKSIVGVWADAMSTTFGVPGYTLELWDPFGAAGTKLEDMGAYFKRPPLETEQAVVQHFASEDKTVAWAPFDHPQLGPVEIGGLEYMRTIRNPPDRLLPAECAQAADVADHMLQALPQLRVEASISGEPAAWTLEVKVENLGFLPTASERAVELGQPGINLRIALAGGLRLADGLKEVELGHLDGWGSAQVGSHRVYPRLPARGHRALHRFRLSGAGSAVLHWQAGRAGSGSTTIEVG